MESGSGRASKDLRILLQNRKMLRVVACAIPAVRGSAMNCETT